ncbi:MAG: hypothetical protein HY286_16265 [Planctomycetes bacterium]|nr:hypothetical protein [Planctomycetota bacterium]
MDPKTVSKTSRRRGFPTRKTLVAVAAGAVLFWGPPVLLSLRIEPGERFHGAIAIFGVLEPAALFFAWRAWFDAPTRAERLGRWVRLALAGPFIGAVAIGAITFFASDEFAAWSRNPQTPAASGFVLPLALLTVRPCQMFLRYYTFAAAPILIILTLLIPKGAHRPLDNN